MPKNKHIVVLVIKDKMILTIKCICIVVIQFFSIYVVNNVRRKIEKLGITIFLKNKEPLIPVIYCITYTEYNN